MKYEFDEREFKPKYNNKIIEELYSYIFWKQHKRSYSYWNCCLFIEYEYFRWNWQIQCEKKLFNKLPLLSWDMIKCVWPALQNISSMKEEKWLRSFTLKTRKSASYTIFSESYIDNKIIIRTTIGTCAKEIWYCHWPILVHRKNAENEEIWAEMSISSIMWILVKYNISMKTELTINMIALLHIHCKCVRENRKMIIAVLVLMARNRTCNTASLLWLFLFISSRRKLHKKHTIHTWTYLMKTLSSTNQVIGRQPVHWHEIWTPQIQLRAPGAKLCSGLLKCYKRIYRVMRVPVTERKGESRRIWKRTRRERELAEWPSREMVRERERKRDSQNECKKWK